MKKIWILFLCVCLLPICACKKDNDNNKPVGEDVSPNNPDITINEYHSSGEYFGICKENITTLGTYPRKIATLGNEGLSEYPAYGVEFTNNDLYDAIYNENKLLVASSETYDTMDSDGNLYLNGVAINRTLYKHSASVGLYGGDVSDNEKAYVKKIEISPRKSGNYITGCYAPAGEIIKIEVSNETLKANPDLKVSIGQMTQNGSNNSIPQGTKLTRMPNITNVMSIKGTESYVGSYFGGPIYLSGIASTTDYVEVTISGAVNYSYLIYGSTTKEEYELNSASSAPYFDLEVYDKGVRHSGLKKDANKYSYEDLIKASQLWENIASVSNLIPGGSNKDMGITFLYDTYVIYGVAAAQVGLNYIQCYTDWLDGALNYNNFVKEGSWGHIHEYNHHFQDYLKIDGEATNNAISLIEYYLFTNVSQNRTETYPNDGNWNLFADPYHSLLKTIANQSKGELHDELNEYADILYSFGYEVFVNACKKCTRMENYDQWFKALCDESGYDLTYYFTKVINKTLSNEALEYAKSLNYPMFIPVASIYQTGRVNHENDTMTVLPFIVNDNSYVLDLNNYLVVPNGVTYTINSFTANDNVTITENGNNVYKVDFLGDETGNMYLDLTLSVDGVNTNTKLILGLSKKYRDLSTVVSPYAVNANTETIVEAQSTTVYECTPVDGWYIYSLSNLENLNNGDDVDILYGVFYELDKKAFDITMDMHKVVTVNKLTICQGFTSAQGGPSKFKLYGGVTVEEMELLGEYEIQYIDSNYATVYFDVKDIQYFKIEVLAVGNNHVTDVCYFSLSKLQMSLDFNNGYQLSPFDQSILIKNNVSKEVDVTTTYGYTLNCSESSITFKITGNKLVLFFKEITNAKVKIGNTEYEIKDNVTIIDLESKNYSVELSGTYKLDSIIVGTNN